jgi:glutathione S-transferase
MVLKLHGASYSTCTKRVITALKETNTPFELVAVDLSKGEHKSPEFVAKQPFGQVPYLVRLICSIISFRRLTSSI